MILNKSLLVERILLKISLMEKSSIKKLMLVMLMARCYCVRISPSFSLMSVLSGPQHWMTTAKFEALTNATVSYRLLSMLSNCA